MKPTEVLSNEHRVIEVGLDCLERVTQNALDEDKLDGESARQLVEFIRNFADGCHHGKEEDHLFKAMTDKGMPAEGGPVGQMLTEHEQGRDFVKGMAANISAAAEGDTGALENYANSARGYVSLLRNHIKKEDHVLFPMADRMLGELEQGELKRSFERVEEEDMGDGTHDRYLRMINELAKKWGVARDALDGHSCGCGH